MHIAQATACTTAFVVAIVTCLGRELLRTVVRTEPEWTFGDLYAYTSWRQNNFILLVLKCLRRSIQQLFH